ncbi:MAG: hypothetical protein LBC37_01590 [Zoogloeaceae bacterium]|jgi:hypothetical protein|nr:hypothetical protein [Zoogloeaceae bacterium]
MEHRSQNLAALLILCLAMLLSGAARAQEAEPAPQNATLLETAKTMQAEAESLRKAADARLEEENAVCARRFLENDCRDAARKRHLESLRASRHLAAQGRKLEYQARVQERDAKRKERAAKAEARKQGGDVAAPLDCSAPESCEADATPP